MSTDITKLNITAYKPSAEKSHEDVNSSFTQMNPNEYYLLGITSRFSPINVALMKVEKKDVLSGEVSEEINKIQNETAQIENFINENKQVSLNSVLKENAESASSKKIDFVEYTSGQQLNTKTDTTNALKNIQYANDEEKMVVEGAIEVLADWLDEYITKYDAKVTDGMKRGDSEAKLSMLLEIRKAIENCDFPIGFGDYSAPEDEYTLGSYSFVLGGYDNYYHLNTHRSILLNSKYLMPERPYESYQAILDKAMAAPDTNFYCTDLIFAKDESYYNYCKNYMASVLVHEFTHSLHIYNEAVTYFINDCFDDDFYNTPVEGVDQSFLDNYFSGLVIKYGDLGISNELGSFEEVVSHGHKNNMNYTGLYVNQGFTISDDRNELLNFVQYIA